MNLKGGVGLLVSGQKPASLRRSQRALLLSSLRPEHSISCWPLTGHDELHWA